jgi:hypothetical protein
VKPAAVAGGRIENGETRQLYLWRLIGEKLKIWRHINGQRESRGGNGAGPPVSAAMAGGG